MSESLISFYRWFMSQGFATLRPQWHAGREYVFDGMTINGIVLCRKGQLQTELFVGYGPGAVPEHSHPNVDSIEVYLSGDILFTLCGYVVLNKEQIYDVGSDGASKAYGRMVRVRPGVRHGAIVGPMGGAFLSVQRWLNDVRPTSVGLDWSGPEFEKR